MENNIAYCIPTYNHPDTINEVLGLVAEMYAQNGIDIYVYDSSETDETCKIVESYCNAGHKHLYYVNIPSGTSADRKVVSILSGEGLRKKYDYIWIVKDRAYFAESTIKIIQSESRKGFDTIFLPVSHLPQNMYPQPKDEIYDDPVLFFKDYGWLVPSLETTLFSCNTLLKDIDWKNFIDTYHLTGFSQFIVLFLRLAETNTPKIRVLREHEVIRYNSGSSGSMWEKEIFDVWITLWGKAINALPKCYDVYKPLVKKNQTMHPTLFGNPHKLIWLAENNILTSEVLSCIKDKWSELSDIPFECLEYIVSDRQDLLINRLALEWVTLFSEQKYEQACYMFHTNEWLKNALGDYKHNILKKCFEIYRIELYYGIKEGIFKDISSYNAVIERYQTVKYMLRRIEYHVADDILNDIIPFFREQSITEECLSYILMKECIESEMIFSVCNTLNDHPKKEH